MSKEIEKRFVNFDRISINNKLKEIGAKKQGMYLFKIINYHNDKLKNVRIRDEGFRKTFTIKEKTADYDIENEIIFENFNEMDVILTKLGMKRKHYSEKIREIYKIDNDSELIFDHYPGLPGYIEVEAPTEEKLKELANTLDLDMNEKFSNYGILYNELYGVNMDFAKVEKLTFDNINELLDNKIIKNKDNFKTIIEGQFKLLEKVDNK